MSEHLGKVIQVRLTDRASVYNCYMSFAKDGGVFVPCSFEAHIGDHLHLLVSLPDEAEVYALSAKVVWIQHGRRKGFGVRFLGDEGSRALKVMIENILGGNIRSANPTYTM